MTADYAIQTNGLTRRFGQTIAVQDLTLTVRRGEIFGFLGHNGAGKTTTVRLLNGVLTPHGGQAMVLGHSPYTEGPALRRRTGVLTESPSLDERLTGRQNLTIYARLYEVPEPEVEKRVSSLLDFFNLADRAGEKVGGYSKGMKQRLALARTLLHNPEIIFLDEPTSGLDPVVTRQVHDLVTRLSREEGRTIFLCTHNLVEAQSLCDRVGVMEKGQLQAVGTPAELARQLGRVQRLQIQVASENAIQAAHILGKMAGVQMTEKPGAQIEITGVDRESTPGLIQNLVSGGVQIYSVTPLPPSLADIYFALHDEKEESR